jgi:redox-sensing transcriptional repressor
MSRIEIVSEVTARRLSIYLRGLQALEADGVRTVSSHDFAERFHLNSDQIRKDLATFGEFGIRGVGYDVGTLKSHLVALLGIDSEHRVAICGAGHLGKALAASEGFNSGGFRIVALFDTDPEKAGTKLKTGVPILEIERLPEFVERQDVDIGVIAVPGEAAATTLQTFVAAKIRAVLNFAPIQLKAPENVFLKNVDLKIHLETLSFYLKNS